MKTIKNLERLQQLHYLILDECTGSPRELSNKLRISERSVYLLLEQLKDYDAKVRYDRSRKTYYYNQPFDMRISFAFSVSSNDEVTDILGGSYFNKDR